MNDEACPFGLCLTDTQARLEASRCLMCDEPPCEAACPVHVPVKHFIRALRFETPRRAINLIRERNVLAGICGLACPVGQLCVGACSSTELDMPIAIGELQHYAAVTGLRVGHKPTVAAATGKRVAIIGGGPSGLSAAAELARSGHQVVILERNPRAGGICTYGVPAHRVPQELVQGEVDYVRGLGVEIRTGAELGDEYTLDSLHADGFAAVYIATGLQQAAMPPVSGAELDGVTDWKTLLDGLSAHNFGEGPRPHMPKNVLIVGGGSVAMDVASAAYTLGATEVDIVCLEAPREMPAYHDELSEVWEEGARFHTRSMPLEVTGKGGKVTGLRCTRIRWKEPDKFVPANAEAIDGTEYWLPGELVVFAIGARPAVDIAKLLPGVKLDHTGRIIADEHGATSRAGVFAGGDAMVAGGTTIVKAVAEGKHAGQAIHEYLGGAQS
ncbi:MAG: FAD-dependent oxidoreductase [Phycisphaerae bacterium]|nr:FAD-dependent oxidoreductase [Phycisphaerae bacterium]